MTQKEKAKELVFKFYTSFPLDDFGKEKYIFVKKHAKNCALMAVDEIIENDKKNYGTDGFVVNYWQEVKQEIEKI